MSVMVVREKIRLGFFIFGVGNSNEKKKVDGRLIGKGKKNGVTGSRRGKVVDVHGTKTGKRARRDWDDACFLSNLQSMFIMSEKENDGNKDPVRDLEVTIADLAT